MNRAGLFFILALLLVSQTSFFGGIYSKSAYYLVVDKSDYELKVYDAAGWLITYPVVFGNKDQGDKLVQGDRKTPEGTFTIVSKKMHDKWCRYLGLDYPNAESYELFDKRKQSGAIPANAKIGGGIGIHGTWPTEDIAVDVYDNWTLGCISMKNEHVKQLYSMIPIGTRITIQR